MIPLDQEEDDRAGAFLLSIKLSRAQYHNGTLAMSIDPKVAHTVYMCIRRHAQVPFNNMYSIPRLCPTALFSIYARSFSSSNVIYIVYICFFFVHCCVRSRRVCVSCDCRLHNVNEQQAGE